MGLETPAVRRFGQLGLGPGARGLGSSSKRVRLGSALRRRAKERELPSALCAEGWSGLGCTWWMLGRVGSMLGRWARWASLCCCPPPGALVVEVPAVYRWCPLHTWAIPPSLGCFNGPVGLAAGKGAAARPVVPGRHCTRLGGGLRRLPSTGTQPMVGWKPWK